MKTYYNHFQYGENLTKQLVFFAPGKERGKKVFFKSPNSDELYSISQKLSDINYPVLVAIDGRDAEYDDIGDSLFEKAQYFFMLLQPASIDDSDDILLKQKECHSNALQIQARMMLDSRNYENGLTNLLPDTFKTGSVGPLCDNLYGVIIGFNVNDNLNYSINEEMWL